MKYDHSLKLFLLILLSLRFCGNAILKRLVGQGSLENGKRRSSLRSRTIHGDDADFV